MQKINIWNLSSPNCCFLQPIVLDYSLSFAYSPSWMLPAPLTKKIKQVLTQWNERISRSLFLSQSPFWIRRIVLLIESICHPCVLLDAKLPKCKKQTWVLWLKKNVYSTNIILLVLSCGNLKGHSVRKFFCLVFSQNKTKKLTDRKTNFTKFELSTTFRSWDVTDKIFPWKAFSL